MITCMVVCISSEWLYIIIKNKRKIIESKNTDQRHGYYELTNLDAGRPNAADATPTSTLVKRGATILRSDLSDRCLSFILQTDFNRPDLFKMRVRLT